MNNVIDLLFYRDRALKQVMDAIAEELTAFDVHWHSLTIEVSVDQYIQEVFLIPLYQSASGKSEAAKELFLFKDHTDILLRVYCLQRLQKDKQAWNKLRIVIEHQCHGYSIRFNKKYDEDLNQLNQPGESNQYRLLDVVLQAKILAYDGIDPDELQQVLVSMVE